MILEIIITDGWVWGIGIAAAIAILIIVGDIKELKEKLKKSETTSTEQKLIFEKKEAEYKLNMNVLATAEFERFKANELETQKKIITENTLAAAKNLLAQWIAENEEKIRKDAANRSVRNVMGKVTEQLLPFSEAMSLFNPKDARFLGSPIDLIIFDGSEELKDEINIVFIEVKTGSSALSKRQKLIKDAIENKRVFWKRVNMRDFGDDVNEALKADS